MSRVPGIMVVGIGLCLALAAQDAPSKAPVQVQGNTVAPAQRVSPAPQTSPAAQTPDDYCRSIAVANGSAAMLSEVCEFALASDRQFPNFICNQTTERYEPYPLGDSRHIMWRTSVITSTVTYIHGQESYSDVAVKGKHARKNVQDLGGMSTRGEFVTVLRTLFDPQSKAHFTFVRETKLESTPALEFDFEVAGENSRWLFTTDEQKVLPPYHGRLWISSTGRRVMRIQQEGVFEPDFPFSKNGLEIDYAQIKLGDRGPFTLPKRSRISACRGKDDDNCWRNDIKFENCRKFTVKAKVVPSEE